MRRCRSGLHFPDRLSALAALGLVGHPEWDRCRAQQRSRRASHEDFAEPGVTVSPHDEQVNCVLFGMVQQGVAVLPLAIDCHDLDPHTMTRQVQRHVGAWLFAMQASRIVGVDDDEVHVRGSA